MSRLHVLIIPFPAQGHVIPLLELSLCLVQHGFKITFVNTEHTHNRVINALHGMSIGDGIRLVSIPDGMEPGEDRNDIGKLCAHMPKVMPGKLEELIEEINRVEEEKLACVIVDGSVGFALEVAEKMKVKKAAFWPASVAILAFFYSIPKMAEDGVIDTDGNKTLTR